MNDRKCIGINSKGEKCGNLACRTEKYCRHHLKQNNYEVCPICMTEENKDNLYKTSCSHYIHLDCAKQLTSLDCPICRKIVTNYPNDIVKSIEENDKLYKSELEQEDYANVVYQEFNSSSNMFDDILNHFVSISEMQLYDNEIIVQSTRIESEYNLPEFISNIFELQNLIDDNSFEYARSLD